MRSGARQLLEERGLETFERGSVLVRQHETILRAHAVLQRILRRRGLAFSVVGPRDFAPLRRLAAARAWLAGTAAHETAPGLDMAVILVWREIGGRVATAAPARAAAGEA